MAALWEEYSQTGTVTTVGTVSTQEIFHNEVDDHIFASAPITIVDGIVTYITDTIDMVSIRLGIFHELMTSTDVGNVPAHDTSWWYRFMAAEGPLVLRLRSKRTIPPEWKLWVHMTKLRGTASSIVNVSEEFLMVRHQ